MHNKFLIFKYAAIMMRCGYAKCINATATAAAALTTTAKSCCCSFWLMHQSYATWTTPDTMMMLDDGVADNATVCVVLSPSLYLSLAFSLLPPPLIISAALCGHPNAIKNQSMAHKTNEKCNKIHFELIAGLGVPRLFLFSFFIYCCYQLLIRSACSRCCLYMASIYNAGASGIFF